jgi:hypothetical protein
VKMRISLKYMIEGMSTLYALTLVGSKVIMILFKYKCSNTLI